jgi:hypothetical protein
VASTTAWDDEEQTTATRESITLTKEEMDGEKLRIGSLRPFLR